MKAEDCLSTVLIRRIIHRTHAFIRSKALNTLGAGSRCPAGTVFYTTTTGAGAPTQIQCFDKLGRGIRTAVQGFDGSYIFTDQYYDAAGRPERVSVPYYQGAAIAWNETIYDTLGRPLVVYGADGSGMANDYETGSCGVGGGPRMVLTTSVVGNGAPDQQRLELKNALGETETVFDDACGELSYEYDSVGNLTRVIGVDNIAVTMNYDKAGRKTSMNDPDKGYWQYRYNALGEMTRQLDSKGQAIDFVYDKLGRVTNRYELNGVSSLGDTSYTTVNRETTSYRTASPGKAQVQSVSYRTGSNGSILQRKDIRYDNFGRISEVDTVIAGLTYTEKTTYDQFGRVFQQFDASGGDRGIRNVYNARGYLSQIKEAREGTQGQVYQSINAMDAYGNVTQMTLGNGVQAFASYNSNNGRLTNLRASKGGIELQDVDYLFDLLGNLKQRHDSTGSANLREDFTYDNLNRLKTVKLAINGASSIQTLALNYDSSGNITYKSDVGNYSYGNNAGPHAVTSAGGISYSYDSNGNQTSGDGRNIDYTVFDKAWRISKEQIKTEFSYGIGNSRYQRKDYNSLILQKTTTYLGSVELIEQTGSNPYFKRYLGGVAIANFYPTTQTQYTQYLLKDHIGSIHTVLGEQGEILARMHFGAFGERQGSATNATAMDWQNPLLTGMATLDFLNNITTRGFTGHEMVDDLGIIHMNGRIYDQKLGRFLQADPIVQAPKNSQSLNRYTYAFNNPLSFTDPSGYSNISSFFKQYWRVIVAVAITVVTMGALAGAAWTGALGAFASGLGPTASYLFAAAGGALAGGISTGTLRGALVGAFTAAAGYGIMQNMQGAEAFFAQSTAGGVGSELGGGKFGNGFLSAGVGFLTGPMLGGDVSIEKFVGSAIVGGTVSRLTGGKFANGAVTAALSYVVAAGVRRIPGKNVAESTVVDAEESRQNMNDALSEFRRLFESGLLPEEYNFINDFEGGLDNQAFSFKYVDKLVSDRVAEMDVYDLTGAKVFRGGANTLSGALDTVAHEIYHLEPTNKSLWQKNPNNPDSITSRLAQQGAILKAAKVVRIWGKNPR